MCMLPRIGCNILCVCGGLRYLVGDVEAPNPVITGDVVIIQLAHEVYCITVGDGLNGNGWNVLVINSVRVWQTIKAIYMAID